MAPDQEGKKMVARKSEPGIFLPPFLCLSSFIRIAAPSLARIFHKRIAFVGLARAVRKNCESNRSFGGGKSTSDRTLVGSRRMTVF
jgi:hypothetical protein